SCSSKSSQDARSNPSDASPSIVEKIADSLQSTSGPSQSQSSAASPIENSSANPSSTISFPPPKKEAWMDTLTDLSGIPAPNAAVLIEADPIPQNLNSVAILISQRYKPKVPVELTLRVFVTEDGRIKRYQMLRTSDPKLGPEYFVHPLLEMRFSPATQNGKPIATWTTLNLKVPKAI
ncbi:MAG: hypothetical protein ABDH66_00005, partial [Bacteroidia bacterium]